jgi:CBS domain-containing protein
MIRLDLAQLPFSLLDDDVLAQLRQGADVAYYDRGEVILDAGDVGQHVFVIEKGAVEELDLSAPSARARIGLYTHGDLFGAISVLNGHSRYRFVADQETLCYLIPGVLFSRLCEASAPFADYFRQRLAEKSRLLTEQREGGVTMAGFMLARVSECMRAPLLLEAGDTIQDAVRALNKQRADSVLVFREGELGIVTKTDMLNAMVLQGRDVGAALGDVAEYRLVTVAPDEFLFAALVKMTRHEVARVVVLRQGRPVGVVELPDVLSYFSSRSYVVGLEVEKAGDLEALALASARLPELVRALMAQGVKLRFAMDLLAALNGRIMSKAFGFVVPAARQAQSCLIVMGSEGRGEQILKTDQDNGLILADDVDWPDREPVLARFSDTLLTLGYPPCPGHVMVNNPEWVHSVAGWRARIARWALLRDGASMMKLAIMLDAHAIAGDLTLLDKVRAALFDQCSRDELLLSQFARSVLKFSTPLTLFGSLKKPQHGIDIKKGGIFPIVHGVRTLALQARIDATSTFVRLERLAASGVLSREMAEDLGEAMSLFAELRLHQQLQRMAEGEPGEGNLLVVQKLPSLERDMLRDALHVVSDFRQHLSRRFHLEY